jgi:polyhydroxybutyrate depolymerase
MRFKSILKTAFYGTNDITAPCLRPAEAGMDRPEGRRRYLVAAPSHPATEKRALVVILHGAGASPEQVLGMAFPPSPLSLWLAIAAREDLVVIAPGAGKGGWSDCFADAKRVARKDDVAFIAALIDHAIARHEVDPARVYVIGVSRGGHMAYRVAAEVPHKLAAFSAVLASMPPSECARLPERPVPVLVFGGTADRLIPYYGGKFFYTLGFADPVSSIEETVQAWRTLAGLPDTPEVLRIGKHSERDQTQVTRYLWGDAADGMQVGLYKIEGGGHVEPSRLKRYPAFIQALVGRQNADVEVAEAAWEFFRDKRARRRVWAP